MNGTEARYSGILVKKNTIQKPKHKIHLSVTNGEAVTALRNFIFSFDKGKRISALTLFDGGSILMAHNKKTEAVLTERFFLT